jgi:hypothetical protein
MRIKIDPSPLLKTRWYEFAVRFLFGGLITAIAGLIAKKFGPGVGGLFLAFPAIFPASATLIEKHEKQNKERAGLHGLVRGRKAIGGLGLLIFAWLVKTLIVSHGTWPALTGATVSWAAVSLLLWQIRKST